MHPRAVSGLHRLLPQRSEGKQKGLIAALRCYPQRHQALSATWLQINQENPVPAQALWMLLTEVNFHFNKKVKIKKKKKKKESISEAHSDASQHRTALALAEYYCRVTLLPLRLLRGISNHKEQLKCQWE